MLKKSQSRQVILFTLSQGAIPVWSTHLYCEREPLLVLHLYKNKLSEHIDCKTNYHRNFYVVDKQRVYHNEIPDILQIGEHQFAETTLVNMWISMMLFSWTSASNCARIYNTTSQLLQSSVPAIPWPFSRSVTSSQVYDAFTLLSLLEDYQLQNMPLVVAHKGSLDGGNRFTEAVRLRNEHFRLHLGKTELLHYCTKCTRFLPGM